MKSTFILLTFSLMIFLFNSCDLFTEEEKEPVSFVADINNDSEFDYLTFSEQDNSFFAVKLYENGHPELAFLNPGEMSDPYPIWFNSDGYPEKMVLDDHIFLFSNFSPEAFDVAIVLPDGEINVLREVPIPEEYQEYLNLKSFSLSDGLRWAGHITSAVACGLSIAGGTAATAATLGISAPVAAVLIGVGCGATALSIASTFFAEEIQEVTSLSATSISAFSTTLDCINPSGVTSCLLGSTALALDVASAGLEQHEEETLLAEAALNSGHGDIQVTLTWDSSADIDLYVQDPDNEIIWYGNKTSTSGGWLDVDDRDGYGPENIFWDTAPDGTYKVFVSHYSGESTNFSVLVQAFGRNKLYQDKIEPGEEMFITDFSPDHLKSIVLNNNNSNLPVTIKH